MALINLGVKADLNDSLQPSELPVPPEILVKTPSTSTLSDADSPVFHRRKKITFVEMHTVASSSVRKSPLQDIMNTPKFQLRKLQRQMFKERDYRDGLEKELSGKISLIAQRETNINQLQYRLEKMQREQSDQEFITREQINELETKNNSLQLRLNEILKENKDCKSNILLIERKVDELEEENGVLSSQMRTADAQLSKFRAEVGRLTETQASGQEEWRAKIDYLHSELSQATAQKELLSEQVQILQGKISCLEDEIRATTKQDVGENMGPVIERDELECEIGRLKSELDSTFGCLKKAEANVEAKMLQLSAYEQEITQHKELLEQQNLHIEDIVRAKDHILKELQKEIAEQRAALQKEIDHLKFQFEQAVQQKAQQIGELQKLIAALQQELDTLRETSRVKEHLLNQTKEKVKYLETRFHDLTSMLVDKDNQINFLKEEVKVFTIETIKNKNEIETKDQLLAQLCLDNSNQKDILQNRIQTLTVEVENLGLSVQRAEQEVQLKHDLLAKTEQENIKQREALQQQIITSEVEACRLSTEIEARNEQLVILQKDSSKQSEILQEQINHLKSHVEYLNNSLTKAEYHVKSLQDLLAKQEQESADHKDLLLQQLTDSEESVRTMKAEIQTKEEHITSLNKQFSEKSEHLHQDIQNLEEQVVNISSSLQNAEENLKSKESLFAKQHSLSTLQIETLQTQIVSSQEELSRLISKLHATEEQLSLLVNESSIQSQLLEQKIDVLDKQLGSTNDSLRITKDQVKAKEDFIAKLEKESTFHIETLKKHNMQLLDEAKQFKEEIQTKEEQLDLFKIESSKQSEALKNDIERFKSQIQTVTESLLTTEEQVKTKVDLLANKEIEISKERNKYQSLMESSSEELTMLRERIQAQEQQLAARKEDSLQTDMLQKEISQQKDQLAVVNNLLSKAEQRIQAQFTMMTTQEQEHAHQKELFQHHLSASEAEMRKLTVEIQVREERIMQLTAANSEQSDLLGQEMQHLKKQVQSIEALLRKAEEDVQSKNYLLTQQQIETYMKLQEKNQNEELLQKQISSFEKEILKLRECYDEKQKLLITTEEKLDMLKSELAAVKTQTAEKGHSLDTLSAEVAVQTKLAQKAKEEAQDNANMLAKVQEEASKKTNALQLEVEDLRRQLAVIALQLKDKGQQLLETQQVSAQLMEKLELQLSASQADVSKMKVEIQVKEEHVTQLKTTNFEQSDLLNQEIQHLKKQVESLDSSRRKAEEALQFKNMLADKTLQKNNQKEELLWKQMSSFEEEILKLRECHDEKQELLIRAEEKLDVLQTELAAVNTQTAEKDHSLDTLSAEVAVQAKLVQKAKEEAQDNANMLAKIQEEASKKTNALQLEVEDLRRQLEVIALQLKDKGQQLLETQQVSAQLMEKLELQLSASQADVSKMKVEIQVKEEHVTQLKTTNFEQSDLLNQEIQHLKKQVESLDSSRRKAEGALQFKNTLADKTLQENNQKEELLRKQMSSFEEEILKLRECHDEKQELLIRAEEKLDVLQTELAAVKTQTAEKDHSLNTFRADVSTQANLVAKSSEEAEVSADMLVKLHEETSQQPNALKLENQHLKGQLEVISLKRNDKDQQLLKTQQDSAQLIENLQLQIVSLSAGLQHKEKQIESFKQREEEQELEKAMTKEKETLVCEKQVLLAKVLRAEKDQKALENQVDILILEKERLVQTKLATERENLASLKLEQALKQELELLKLEKARLWKEMERNEESKRQKKELQEQLVAKTEAVEHYKAQMEKAVSHYNDKKQLLHDSQEEVATLKHSLEVKERQVNATGMELKLLQLELEKAQNKETNMLNKLTRLEAQVAFADLNLCAHNQLPGHQEGTSESCYLELPSSHSNVHTKVEPKRIMSSDSLDQSSLEDSLNNTRKLSAPDESSTPLVRSSERLAAKRRGQKAESLETLYFTPINARHINRTTAGSKTEVDQPYINPSSSVKRRRTTQVINITMTKKTPGGIDGDETFYSLASARSQPNLSSAHGTRPVSMELFDTPAKLTATTSDQLSSLPGYGRSTLQSQTASTFCVGAENEPEGAPDDWMRIAELQARNRACLPHLKSSYPVEFETGYKSALTFTDEDVRTGDPTETFRRATIMPGQLQDSLASHRHSLAPGQSNTAASVRSHRLPLMTDHPSSKLVSSSQLKSPRCKKQYGSTSSVHQTSPEKWKASCFPRPLTPKNKSSGPSSSQLHPAFSPVDRRQSMMFTINNTPTNSSNYLKRSLNKLRSSTRKSPGKTSKRSPAKENKHAATSRAVAGRGGRVGGCKPPHAVAKENKKSPQTSGKSPRLIASARKMKRRM